MSRRTTILGRGGTVLIAISLALLLVSLIPPITLREPVVDTTDVAPDTFTPLSLIPIPIEAYFDCQLTPQQELQMDFTASGTVTVYVLEVDTRTLLNWISEQQQKPARDFNLTRLEEFLGVYPDSIGWSSEIHNEEIEHTYVPKKVTNATIILANPSSDTVIVLHQVTTANTLAPGDKVLNTALWTAPIGIILAIPWILNRWKQRKQK
jgi:hypothetical protein